MFESGTARALGELSHHVPAAPFVVADSSVIFLTRSYYRTDGDDGIAEPMQLQARDLASGRTLWKTAVADSNYTGPIAP